MEIIFYKSVCVEGNCDLVRCTADIDLSKIRSFSLINQVIRRKDRYIRRFSKKVQIIFESSYKIEDCSIITSLDKMYLEPLKAYAKEVGGFKKTKEPIVELKKTRYGLVERKAINWHWDRETKKEVKHMFLYRAVGSTLKNGATVIALGTYNQDLYVLTFWCKEYVTEYVTWLLDEQGNTILGHYFKDIFSAVKDFKERLVLK